jgi:acyl-coenzyme A thioesterase PaaI-like protein
MKPLDVYNALLDTVPMNKTLNLKSGVMTDEEFGMVLPYDKNYSNHLKGPHASAMFLVAEATSGGVAILTFGPDTMKMRPVVRRASAEYIKFMQGDVHSVGKIDKQAAEKAHKEMAETGKARLDVEVEVRDADENVGVKFTFEWALKKMS